MSDRSLSRVLAAALTLFGRHGFQRTSMADVAREAGIARGTLYLRFSDKRALFEALAASLVDEALARADVAWVKGAPLSTNIAATLIAKDLAFFHMLNATPHGAELLELDAELTAPHVARLDEGFVALLCRRGREAVGGGRGPDGLRRCRGLRDVPGDRRFEPQAPGAHRGGVPVGRRTPGTRLGARRGTDLNHRPARGICTRWGADGPWRRPKRLTRSHRGRRPRLRLRVWHGARRARATPDGDRRRGPVPAPPVCVGYRMTRSRGSSTRGAEPGSAPRVGGRARRSFRKIPRSSADQASRDRAGSSPCVGRRWLHEPRRGDLATRRGARAFVRFSLVRRGRPRPSTGPSVTSPQAASNSACPAEATACTRLPRDPPSRDATAALSSVQATRAIVGARSRTEASPARRS